MRPRVFPAEDAARRPKVPRRGDCFNEAAGIPRGRLCPMPCDDGVESLASMRPRVFPAEDLGGRGAGCLAGPDASMRPRVFPAEDVRPHSRISPTWPSFNEAAGIPRGRRGGMGRGCAPTESSRFNEAAGIPRGRRVDGVILVAHLDGASMRPRVFPAEDAAPRARWGRRHARFNEAAGIPRGRPGRCRATAGLSRTALQ